METCESPKYHHAIGTYIGLIGVKTPMKTLNKTARSEVARESIYRVCEAVKAKRKTNHRNATNDDSLIDIVSRLDDEPDLTYSGKEVELRVTDSHLEIISREGSFFEETECTLFRHEMANVSFASTGDEDTSEFVAYIAKDSRYGRACFVLKCGLDAKRILDSIGYRFIQRSKHILSNNTIPKSVVMHKSSYLDKSPRLNLPQQYSLSPDSRDVLEASYKCNNENQSNEAIVAETRQILEKEPWFHGTYLSREESETRLKEDGDFLVRESEPGHFVLSVMNEDTIVHLLFDSLGQVKTKGRIFDDISTMVKYHYEECLPIVTTNRTVYLRNAVHPVN